MIPIWSTLWAWLVRRLDTERVTVFQTMYYTIFTAFAMTLMACPGCPHQEASDMMKPFIYHLWLGLNFVCPILTLSGRRLTRLAALQPPGKANPALGAAWMQLAGDMGVWSCVNLWMISLFQTDWWKANLFVVFFMVMGVLGGAMFTARSLSRIIEIWHRDRVEAQAQT